MEGGEENRSALLMGLDMLTNISYVDEVRPSSGGVLSRGASLTGLRACARAAKRSRACTRQARSTAPLLTAPQQRPGGGV